MNKLVLVLLSLIILPIGLQAQKATNTELKSKAFALEIAKKYYPASYDIINEVDAASVSRWMKNAGEKINASDFALTVHECVHGYDAKITVEEGYNWETKMWNEGYFIDKDLKIITTRFEVFKTSELHASYFPSKVKQLSRYGTYIHSLDGKMNNLNKNKSKEEMKKQGLSSSSESSASTNIHGLFGLLEEFNAYYHGIRAKYEMLKSDENLFKQDKKAQSNVKDDHVASYYEFNIFMAYYLKYAKEKKPEIYEKLMKSKELRLTYTLIEANWRNLLTEIYSNEKIANSFPCYEGEDALFTDELEQIMETFKLQPERMGTKYQAFVATKKYDPKIIEKNRTYCNEDFHFLEEDIDIDADNATTITEKRPGFFYVVVNSTPNYGNAIMEHMTKYEDDYPNSSLFLGTDLSYHIYLARFKDKNQAQSMANEIRVKYPTIKVL